jgi:hypothetical protein
MGAHDGAVEHLHQMRRRRQRGEVIEEVSNTPDLLSRSKRFHTLFHLPNRSGSARHEMLWTEK